MTIFGPQGPLAWLVLMLLQEEVWPRAKDKSADWLKKRSYRDLLSKDICGRFDDALAAVGDGKPSVMRELLLKVGADKNFVLAARKAKNSGKIPGVDHLTGVFVRALKCDEPLARLHVEVFLYRFGQSLKPKDFQGVTVRAVSELQGQIEEVIRSQSGSHLASIEVETRKLTELQKQTELFRLLVTYLRGDVEEFTPADPIDWHNLHKAFKDRTLDQIDLRPIGLTEGGPRTLPLKQVYFPLEVRARRLHEILEREGAGELDAGDRDELLKLLDLHEDWLWQMRQEEWRQKARWELVKGSGGERLDDDDRESLQKAASVFARYALQAVHDRNTPQDRDRMTAALGEAAASGDVDEGSVLAGALWLCQQALETGPLKSALEKTDHALLVGHAGYGKSTFCRFLADRCFDALGSKKKAGFGYGLEKETPIPVYVRLERVADFVKPDVSHAEARSGLLDYICHYWRKDLVEASCLTRDNLLAAPRVLLLLDGLDEVPESDVRLKVAQTAALLKDVRGWRIIMATRPAGTSREIERALGFQKLEINELDERTTSRQFAGHFLKAYHYGKEKPAEADVRAFLDAMDASPGAQRLAGNPLLLTVMIMLHKKQKVLPHRRVELYDWMVKLLLAQKAAEPGSPLSELPRFDFTDSGLERSIKWTEANYLRILRQAAYLTHADPRDTVCVSRTRVVAVVKDLKLIREDSGVNLDRLADRFLDFADNRLGLLVYRASDFAFAHRSLQEFLAAEHLARVSEDQFRKLWDEQLIRNPANWREVICLVCSLMREGYFIFPFLEEKVPALVADADAPAVLILLGDLMAELEEFFPEGEGMGGLHEMTRNALNSRRERSYGKKSAPIFLAAGDALARINEPRINVANPPMVEVPSGEFTMGASKKDDPDAYGDEDPPHPRKVDTFWLGKYPVANGEFAAFIKDGGYEQRDYWIIDGDDANWQWREKEQITQPEYWDDPKWGRDRTHAPVVGVSWYEAAAYCRWWTAKQGKGKWEMRLPSEAEWEYAAKGGVENRKYPWGDEGPTEERCNWEGNLGQTSAVGSFPKGACPWPDGDLLDMGGNVWEWTADWYQAYPGSKYESEDFGEKFRVVRGGSWLNNYTWFIRTTNRHWNDPDLRDDLLGFRGSFLSRAG